MLHVCVDGHVCICECIYVYVCMHVDVYIRLYMYVCECIYVCTCIYMHVWKPKTNIRCYSLFSFYFFPLSLFLLGKVFSLSLELTD